MKRIAWIVVIFGVAAFGSERPRIVGIANIAVKVDNLEEARKFYSGVVGMDEVFTTKDPAVAGDLACFKVNDRQYVEVSPTLKGDEDRLIRIGFETSDARKLRDYLDAKGVSVPAKVDKDANGNRSFVVKDPEGHAVQFVQYMPGSVHSRNFGKHLAAARISDHILHVGVRIVDPAKADTFYKDILGFRLQWKGGPTDTKFEWISYMVPGRVRLDRVHGAGHAAYAATVRGSASLRARHAGHPAGVQNCRGAGLQAASGAEYRARRALATATLRQEFHADGDDDPQAGADSVLLAEPGRLQAMRQKIWSNLPAFRAASTSLLANRKCVTYLQAMRTTVTLDRPSAARSWPQASAARMQA